MNNTQTRSAWQQEVLFRLKSHWFLKMIGITTCITSFMVVYFALLNHPQFPVTAVPWTPLDRMIGFHPWAIVPYASLWLYISLVPALLLFSEELPAYFSTISIQSLIGFTIFFFWPTTVVQPDINWDLYPYVGLLKTVAPSGNACPSMHVAFSVLTVFWMHRLLTKMNAPSVLRGLNIIWCLLILWSTMSLKQHLILDVVSGTALALIITLPHLYLFAATRRKTPLSKAVG